MRWSPYHHHFVWCGKATFPNTHHSRTRTRTSAVRWWTRARRCAGACDAWASDRYPGRKDYGRFEQAGIQSIFTGLSASISHEIHMYITTTTRQTLPKRWDCLCEPRRLTGTIYELVVDYSLKLYTSKYKTTQCEHWQNHNVSHPSFNTLSLYYLINYLINKFNN